MISRVKHLPLVKQESFLRLKYEQEGLSVNEIAKLTFSSRQTVVKYLKEFGINLQAEDQTLGPLAFGKKWRNGQVVNYSQEQRAIETVKKLRAQGMSYGKIAAVMTNAGIKTKSGWTPWYAKTNRDIILRNIGRKVGEF